MSTSSPLSAFENKARIHAHIMFFGYLVALPLGIFIPRYLRTFFRGWFWPHAIMNFFITGPLIFTGFALGYQTTTTSGFPHFTDPHQKAGLALFIMYLIQVFLGAFIHWIKFPFRFPGGRHPQNYLHAILGLSIIGLASWQTHYGLWTEWGLITGDIHPVNSRCRHFWLGIVIVRPLSFPSLPALTLAVSQAIWAIYGLGLLLLPRQFKQEAASRRAKEEGAKDDVNLI
ncbi:hypothetical protein C8F04DRAFT_1300837 [Mycena alexandri]|uniref:Cytochrome b561 domain-containing protein n=1 Tax=Mycena alexandri TaxID=1745969 RepID=A0AAD6T7Y4_9AGAR|nr:hypothetical protein C8F04DRAFT_1300837 [Mycena alexandri]